MHKNLSHNHFTKKLTDSCFFFINDAEANSGKQSPGKKRNSDKDQAKSPKHPKNNDGKAITPTDVDNSDEENDNNKKDDDYDSDGDRNMNTNNKKQQKDPNQSSSCNTSGPATQTTNPISVFVTRPKQQQQRQQSQQQRPQQHTSAGHTSSNNNRTSANIAMTYQQLEETHAWAQGMTALTAGSPSSTGHSSSGKNLYLH